MVKIAIITGSTREKRLNIQVAEWLKEFAWTAFPEHYFEILDIKDFNLPRVEGYSTPDQLNGIYNHNRVQEWSDCVQEFDGYVFVTPEYNNNVTSTLKDALDHLSGEFHHKSAGIVSYGGTLGMSASVVLRITLANFRLAVVSTVASFSLHNDFTRRQHFAPAEHHYRTVMRMLADTIMWAEGLKMVREK